MCRFHWLYAHVTRYSTLRFLFAFKAQRGYNVLQLDVENAFLSTKKVWKRLIWKSPMVWVSAKRKKLFSFIEVITWPQARDTSIARRTWRMPYSNWFSGTRLRPQFIFQEGSWRLLVAYVNDILIFGRGTTLLHSIVKDMKMRFDIRVDKKASKFFWHRR